MGTCSSFTCPPAPWKKVLGVPVCLSTGCTEELCCVRLTTTPCTTTTHLTCSSFTCPPAPWTKVPGDPVCAANGCTEELCCVRLTTTPVVTTVTTKPASPCTTAAPLVVTTVTTTPPPVVTTVTTTPASPCTTAAPPVVTTVTTTPASPCTTAAPPVVTTVTTTPLLTPASPCETVPPIARKYDAKATIVGQKAATQKKESSLMSAWVFPLFGVVGMFAFAAFVAVRVRRSKNATRQVVMAEYQEVDAAEEFA